jgi:hypothetical protein
MTDTTTLVMANLAGEGLPECQWDFAAWAGGLKITANCPAANITLTGDQLRVLGKLVEHARETDAA